MEDTWGAGQKIEVEVGDYPDLKRKCLRPGWDWEADRVLIEDAASGKQPFHDCFEANRRRFARLRPEKDKGARFNAA